MSTYENVHGGLGGAGGVINSGLVDESLVSSVNDGVLDLGVLAGESSSGMGDGQLDGDVLSAASASTSSEAGRRPRRAVVACVRSAWASGNEACQEPPVRARRTVATCVVSRVNHQDLMQYYNVPAFAIYTHF
jgi:hypothetical protein